MRHLRILDLLSTVIYPHRALTLASWAADWWQVLTAYGIDSSVVSTG